MSKFIRLISTFRNGLLSARLRGSIVEPADGSSAEVLENFLVDRTGSLIKRPGLIGFTKTTKTAYRKTYHELDFLGTKYLFKIDGEKYFNSVDGSYNSTWITNLTDSTKVKVFGTGVATSSTNATDMFLWNGRHSTAGNYISSGLTDYLTTTPVIFQCKKVTDRTYVFTTNTFSFLISLLDKPDTNNTIRQFYVYPYFVNNLMLINTLNKNIGAAVACPISPSNFPFNSINTDTSLVINTGEMTESGNSQTGSSITLGVMAKSNDRLVWNVEVPQTIHYLNGAEVSLVGRFLRLPTSDATKDTVFFLTKRGVVTGSIVNYTAIQVIGGTPLAGTSLWTFSTWGADNHPKAAAYCFGRLIYGNVKNSPSQWWAGAVHPNNPRYFQGFLQSNLPQDSNSDFSGMNYAGATSPASTDIFRFGFTNQVPSIGEICWINSRRKIHFGTSNGECQVDIFDGIYDRANYKQNILGSNKSSFQQSVGTQESEGDRKIFYLSNNFKDIRIISTEDKDYESLDVLSSISIEGKDIFFQKIEWIEEFSCLFCMTTADQLTGKIRLFSLAIHTDTQIKAFSELVFDKDIYYFTGTNIILSDDTHDYVSKINALPFISNSLTPVRSIYADLFFIINPLDDLSVLDDLLNTTVYFYNGVTVETFDVPSTGSIVDGQLSFDRVSFQEASVFEYGQIYVYPDKIRCKYKSTPIHEGAKFGSSVGDIQRVDRVSVLVDNSGKFKYGSESGSLIEVEGFSSATFVNGITGIINLDLPQSPDKEQFVLIESDDPSPLNISGISLRGVSYSGE